MLSYYYLVFFVLHLIDSVDVSKMFITDFIRAFRVTILKIF